MNIQDPPMVLYFECKKGEPFNKDFFAEYRISGKKYSYLVWPAVLLCQNGATVKKGVAQPKKKSVDIATPSGTSCSGVGRSFDELDQQDLLK